MTTIASPLYYALANRYAAGDKLAGPIANDASADFSRKQDTRTKAASTTSAYAEDSAPTMDSRPSTVTVNFQGKLLNINLLDTSNLKKINVSELPEDQYQSFMEREQQRIAANRQFLENQYTRYTAPDYSNDPRMKSYATITVGGQVVAKIDNQGVIETDDALGAKLRDMLLGDVNGTNGPDLAQARAQQIATLVGGTIVKSNTAMTQNHFNALPPIEQPKAVVDYEAMKQDPLYAQLQNMSANFESTKQKRTEYLAQQ